MNRAVSTFTIKSIDDEQRIIEGIASTPTVDRVGDVVDPYGATLALPVPFLYQHDKNKPIGHIIAANAGDDGIKIKAQVAKGVVPFIDEAWALIKAGLVRGLSIGFRPHADGREAIKGGGWKFKSYEILEISAVTVPANADASISIIKAISDDFLAASGKEKVAVVRLGKSPGVSGTSIKTPKGIIMAKTTAETISGFETKRAAVIGSMTTIMEKSAEDGATLDEEQTTQYDDAATELKTIDAHLERLRKHEQIMLTKATPITHENTSTQEKASNLRGGQVITVHSNVEKGTAFTRYALAIAMAKGNLMHAEKLSERWKDSTPEVGLCLKAAVAAGSTSDATWAAPLVPYNVMASEFIELLRPKTILGKLPNLRKVPFNIRIPRQTAGVSGAFVGEGLPKPVQKMGFDNITMLWAKAAVIIVLSDELARFSNPSAEALARQDMLNGLAQYLDDRFINPSYAGVAGVSPASITNGITPVAASGVTIAAISGDVKAMRNSFAVANLDLMNSAWIMNPSTALSLSLVRNAFDAYDFPTIAVDGGTWFGLPVITSNNIASSVIVLVDQSEILYSDDGGISIDMSQEASVQMNDSPTAGATSLVSLWQNNLIGLRAEKWCNWARRRDAAVSVLTGVAY